MQVEIIGLASGRRTALAYSESELALDLLTWLRSKGITVASSCGGEGVCKKCVIQNGWLTCELTLKEFLQRQPNGKIEISYL